MTALAMTADDSLDEAEVSPFQRPLAWAAGVAALALVGGLGWTALHYANRQPVARIQIEGRFVHLKAADIDAAVRPLADRPFGELDLRAIRSAVERLPWAAHVSVERVWPGTVRVRADERVPFARWGDHQLLDIDAQPFDGEDPTLTDLPQLDGTPGKEAVVAEMYRALSAQLKDSSFALQGLSRDARGEWIGRTHSGLELRLGREDPQDAITTLLGPAERLLKNRISEVKYLDLRYTNGFSVGWQSAPPTTHREVH